MKKLPKATTVKKALIAFVFTFCTPALVMMAYETYASTGRQIGQIIYESTHKEVNL